MDGGNLSLPAVNARALGAVPWVTRVDGVNSYVSGEKLLGINRFSFETTNSAMYPIIQSQELSHPQVAARHPDELKNVLAIPNEEEQFLDKLVEDDTGQVHTLIGGSPFGTIIRAFRTLSDRSTEGLAPSVSESGVEPNLKIRLPNPDSVPGNILVRSGFDRLQAYQTETMGSGGMLGAGVNSENLKHLFDNTTSNPRLGPTFDNQNWEHISQKSSGISFPDSSEENWVETTANNPLQSSYELHDRTLFFHITKSGHTHTHKYPVSYSHANGVVNNDLTGVSYVGTTLTVNAAVNTSVFTTGFGEQEKATLAGDPAGRRFLRLYDPTTDRGGVASYTAIAGSTFTGCVGDAEFDELVSTSITSLKVVPSYYIPAGSTRFYASRRLRDHAEVSGASPDMAQVNYFNGVSAATLAHVVYSKPVLTPLPIPRMGHHFVTPTMAMLPGHWAHPAYQGLYDLQFACRSSTNPIKENNLMSESEDKLTLKAGIKTATTQQFNPLSPPLTFGALTATPSGPSDIHGGAFTLMFESKIRADGYGVLASKGQAGVINSKGGHSIVLEGAANYTLNDHFPDPSEVGAYQVIVQPNLHSSQFLGFHANGAATALPDGSVKELTSQQVALVIGIKTDYNVKGGITLVLAEAIMADVRGCEIFINEVMLDHDPDYGSQFTNIPPLLLYNPLGLQGTESPSFTRKSFPYHPGMFNHSTPEFTVNIPWWSILHTTAPDDTISAGFRYMTQLRFDNYYEFLRASNGSISCQLTLAGYPSIYPDVYSSILENVSLNPRCTVMAVDKAGTAGWNPTAGTHSPRSAVKVDNARGFLEKPYYNQKLEYTDVGGSRRVRTYDRRTGVSHGDLNEPTVFLFASVVSGTDIWWDNLTVGSILRLTRGYDNLASGEVLKDSKNSIITRNLPQTLQGSRDTNSLHLADSYLCLWHPNLGRPHTFYSDVGRTWLSPTSDRAIAAKSYNSMPEHFETIHYHDVNYQASMGPFGFQMTSPKPPIDTDRTIVSTAIVAGSGGTGLSVRVTTTGSGAMSQFTQGKYVSAEGKVLGIVVSVTGSVIILAGGRDYSVTAGKKIYIDGDGSVDSASNIDAMLNYTHQGGKYDAASSTKVMYNKFWPCGSRGGPLVSRLDGYAEVSTSWSNPKQQDFGGPVWKDLDDDGSYVAANGLGRDDYDDLSGQTRPRPFGYRFGIRQPYNRPQWGLHGARGYIEIEEATGVSIFALSAAGTGYSVATNVATSASASGTGCTVNIDAVGGGGAITAVSIHTPGTNYAASEVVTVSGGGGNATLVVATKTLENVSGYYHGPLVQHETQTWTYKGAGTGAGDVNKTYPTTYVGILERQTNFSGMLGPDKSEWQVRYNEGRRMTRPYGCPVRTLRNKATVARDWWGDSENKALSTIDQIAGYYIVDWWGNTRGEDVRRYPVRSIGIKPAWDAGNAYEYDRTNNRTPWDRLLNNGKPIFNILNVVAAGGTTVSLTSGYTLPRFGGNLNNDNNNTTNKLVDVFAPTNSMRVGDMGNGRGIRYPTQFNEDILTALGEPTHVSGLVLSGNTAEPPIGNGFIRARNDTLQNDEIPRGISNRLDIAEDGLLKPEAVVSDKTEVITGDSPHKDAISRSSPRIGLDADNLEDIDANVMVINTEAHSLHTDRNVGQRVVLHGGMIGASSTLIDYDLTAIDFAGQPRGGVMRFSHTNPFSVLGGTYILESKNYLNYIDDTGWGTQLPTSGMVLWLKADEFDLADGAAVTQWDDVSGNSRHFAQGSASLQPAYVASESDFNNMPAVRHDGSDKLELAFDAALNTNQFTLFIVPAVNVDNNTHENIIESRSSTPVTRSGFNIYGDMTGSGGYWEFWAGQNTGWSQIGSGVASAAITVGTPAILTTQISGGDGAGAAASQLLRVNGTVVGTATPNYYKSTGGGGQQIGTMNTSSYQLDGEIAEIIQYNRVLTTDEIEKVEAYLGFKYNISGPDTWKTSNPYETTTYRSKTIQTNYSDKSVKFLIRPVRMLDNSHIEIFRTNNDLHSSSPQYGSDAYSTTSGGKYGVYVYETPNGRAGTHYLRASNPDCNPPYAPVYYMDSSISTTSPQSQGPKILGTEVTGYDKTTLSSTVSRLVISENTLQHYRSDASRRRTPIESDDVEKRLDFNIEPRFSQSLHPKGDKGDVSFNVSDHSGDGT